VVKKVYRLPLIGTTSFVIVIAFIAVLLGIPGVTPETPGVQTTLKPAVFRKLATKGFRIGSLGIDVPVQTILDAAAAFTGGRLVAC
jgi:hypothetical protein